MVWERFLLESLALSPLGGTVGLLIGGLATVGYSLSQGWPPTVPLAAVAGGLAGAAADVYPSIRARLTPTKALAAL